MNPRNATLDGFAEPPFAGLAEAFRHNLAAGGEGGAAVAVYVGGRKVVDLWGGVRDIRSGAPWREDTVVPVFSTSKGVTSIACLLAASRGAFALTDPISRHWPAFAQAGKSLVTVRQVLDHSAGLTLFGRAVHQADLADPARMARLLEAMAPQWPPGTRWGYHLATFGPLLAEVIARTDAVGRRFGPWFAEEIARPLAIDFRFGLPGDLDPERLAFVEAPSRRLLWSALGRVPGPVIVRLLNPRSALHRATGEMLGFDINDPGWLRPEFPSANGIGNARALAALYAEIAAGAPRLGIDRAVLTALAGPAGVPPHGPRDQVMGVDAAWHLGFTKPSRAFPFSPSPAAFGMPGLGGSFAFCDPSVPLAYAYTPCRLGPLPFNDPREMRLRAALHAALDLPHRAVAAKPFADTAH